jgi:hypothetical protein
MSVQWLGSDRLPISLCVLWWCRRQTLSCPDLTNIGMRPMGMLPGNAESMVRILITYIHYRV